MLFTVVDKKDLFTKKYKKSKLQDVFEEFLKMDVDSVLFNWKDFGYLNAKSCINTLSNSAKNYGYPVIVLRRRDKVYLVRG